MLVIRKMAKKSPTMLFVFTRQRLCCEELGPATYLETMRRRTRVPQFIHLGILLQNIALLVRARACIRQPSRLATRLHKSHLPSLLRINQHSIPSNTMEETRAKAIQAGIERMMLDLERFRAKNDMAFELFWVLRLDELKDIGMPENHPQFQIVVREERAAFPRWQAARKRRDELTAQLKAKDEELDRLEAEAVALEKQLRSEKERKPYRSKSSYRYTDIPYRSGRGSQPENDYSYSSRRPSQADRSRSRTEQRPPPRWQSSHEQKPGRERSRASPSTAPEPQCSRPSTRNYASEVNAWYNYTVAVLSNDNRVNLKYFPTPPSAPCTTNECTSEDNLAPGVCSCAIRSAFEAAPIATGYKKEATRWHPDKFSCCSEPYQEQLKRQATMVFKIVKDILSEGADAPVCSTIKATSYVAVHGPCSSEEPRLEHTI
ncbi:hypothetical protein AC579_2781 [Pseudocercospora musae]|uniref:J domain-containing protein n=1 Tax=Pseudocercospora musae TaxID=113226 RepID=A0A139H1X0_9PEZI|nr:hypothetical protein AC579_2781 [Pseudocercospora musae]